MGYTKSIIALICYAMIVKSVFQNLQESNSPPLYFWIALIITFVIGYYLSKEMKKDFLKRKKLKETQSNGTDVNGN